MASRRQLVAVGCSVLLAYAVVPFLQRTITATGAFRNPKNTPFSPGDFVTIEDTTHCEDIHYHAASNRIFTACEDSPTARFSRFPPLANFDDPILGEQQKGSIHVINAKTKKSQRLRFENWDASFVTHGIDVIDDPALPVGKAVYVFAVNHAPNDSLVAAVVHSKESGKVDFDGPKERALVEIFHHVLGSSSIKHIRSVQHPLITTPNDVVATSPDTFYVTNDHHYTEGSMRLIEDLYFRAKWSNTIKVDVTDMKSKNGNAFSGVQASVALDKMHNNNGLAHGKSAREILVGQAMSAVLHIGEVPEDSKDSKIRLVDTVQIESLIDNPSYFSDPYKSSSYDASGYVLPGLTRSLDIAKTMRDLNGVDPVMVWIARPAETEINGRAKKWEQKLLFEDDGSRIRSASGAVLVPIDPKLEGGKRKAWLYVTGFMSQNMIAAKVDI